MRPLIAVTILSLGLGAAGASAELAGPPGAADVFSSNDPAMQAARRLIAAGELARAEELLQKTAADRPELVRACDDGREIIRRFRLQYSLTADGLLERLKRSIPDVALADLDRWREAGEVQTRVFDGEVAYFSREPANIFRFCPEARRRVKTPPSPPTVDAKVLAEHLQKVLSEAEREGKDLVVPVRHRVRYRLRIPGGHPALKAGATVRCWLPFPQECRQQSDVKLLSTSPENPVIAPSTMDRPEATGSRHRTVYLEQKVSDPDKPVTFREEFEYTCRAFVPRLRDEEARPLPADYSGGNLGERPPHIVFSPELKKTVQELVAGEPNPLVRARKIYLWITANIKYHAEEEYCLIPSIVTKCFESRRGDCGVQGLLFITMCRAAGIPARWQSGWETKPVGWDMHDWAEFYVAPWGWLPADPSYGLQKSDDPAIREFYFGHLDSYRMIVNADYGWPLEPAKPSLRSEPADFQRGEVEVDGKNLYYDSWDYQIQIEWK